MLDGSILSPGDEPRPSYGEQLPSFISGQSMLTRSSVVSPWFLLGTYLAYCVDPVLLKW